MSLVIRPIEPKDFETLIILFKEFALFEKLPEKMMNSVELIIQESEFLNGFVAVDSNDEILGYVTYFFAYYTWIGKSLYMDDLYVRPAHRGLGIGTLLLNKVVEFAKQDNCKKLRWQVSAWNQPAIEFYKKQGACIDDVESNCDLIF